MLRAAFAAVALFQATTGSNNTSISAQRSFNFTFGRGTHNISLTVRNSAGLASTATAVIVVNEQVASHSLADSFDPTARFTMSGGGKSGSNGQTLTYSVPAGGNVTITFDAANSVAGSGSISSYDWRSNNTSISTQRSFNFTFGRGTHNISLTVRNSAGLVSTATASSSLMRLHVQVSFVSVTQ
jgi:PKD repeat protein